MNFFTIRDQRYPVTVSTVYGHCHSASVTVDGKEYTSRDVPFGMRHVAVDDLLGRVQKDHPSAAWD